MLIYRIEDTDGGGLYRGDRSYANPITSNESDRHPVPEQDSRLMVSVRYRMELDLDQDEQDLGWHRFLEKSFIFGFASVDQLRNWVYQDEWLDKMDDSGFVLSVFDVPEEHICIGNTQVVFRRHEAISHRRYTMPQFFNL